ncbi:signal peptidase I [Mucilaginibacter hurinus]|uniref:Signal peptidase I n=1 Tax=Mucilaginibacter hurinus TaxID=2201324 RepID=A0A367GNU5_9SPHI|nr:signal peptidase I [Mucilaginibacter hurinus]RCH55154.1 signal peptidase I [Mucilaginibacter hurinus]
MVGRVTHAIDIYNVPTSANQPAIQPGTRLIASSLKRPVTGAFIVFNHREQGVNIFRCIGKENDIIEVKDATVYRNNVKIGEPYVWNEYVINNLQLGEVEGYFKSMGIEVQPIGADSFSVTLSENQLKEYRLSLKRRILPGTPNALHLDFKSRGFTPDNFGPVKVPAKSYFLLGDNRHDAMDSRYLGFINEKDIISTAISH